MLGQMLAAMEVNISVSWEFRPVLLQIVGSFEFKAFLRVFALGGVGVAWFSLGTGSI